MADIGWRRRRGSSPAARTGARQRAGLTPASASNTLSCQRETLHSQQLRSIKKSIDSDHGIYRDTQCRSAFLNAAAQIVRDWRRSVAALLRTIAQVSQVDAENVWTVLPG